MGWIKNRSLKQTFFLLALTCLAVSLFLVALTWAVCTAYANTIPSGGISIDFSGTVTALAPPSPGQKRLSGLLTGITILSCILFPVSGLGIAATLFYHWKLKRPIAILRAGTERIRQQDLTFSIPHSELPKDELGQVCAAFETMRVRLLETNRELWRQAEEYKRLNAAFSHNLRNPITVLKGTVTLMRQGIRDDQTVRRLETYTLRMERYVETMGSIQRLSQMPLQTDRVSVSALCMELRETAKWLAPAQHTEISTDITCTDAGTDCKTAGQDIVLLDHALFLTVAENLMGNAARFACRCIRINLSLTEGFLSLTVSDDGDGYPAHLLNDGPKPFGTQDTNPEHFGMGLYSSLILCQKHGGTLKLRNREGAVAAAGFRLGTSSNVFFLESDEACPYAKSAHRKND